MNGDIGMGYTMHGENRGNKEIPLAILSSILAQSCVANPCLNNVGRGLRMIVLVSLNNVGRGVTHDCASILDSIDRGISFFPRFFT